MSSVFWKAIMIRNPHYVTLFVRNCNNLTPTAFGTSDSDGRFVASNRKTRHSSLVTVGVHTLLDTWQTRGNCTFWSTDCSTYRYPLIEQVHLQSLNNFPKEEP